MRARLILPLLGLTLCALSACAARHTTASLHIYSQHLKPGMTRKEVEDYFRSNKIAFAQMCCIQPHKTHPLDDLVKVGTQHFPIPCGDQSYYVAFIFSDRPNSNVALGATPDDLDMLQSIIALHWVDDCF
jgi:hypothetical protein